ncbi:hypothetical protein EON83_20320 [bacterium]|nr:MAG: hypothetical protein EON83_20320 [bacterium]
MTKVIETRPAFAEAHPELAIEHRNAQRAFFGAARNAHLNWDRDDQIEGINAAFGLRGGHRIISRKQLTPAEYRALVVAIEARLFSRDWTWDNEFTITIHTREVTEVHFEPTVNALPATSSDWMDDLMAGMTC